jgi:hypothetical protein
MSVHKCIGEGCEDCVHIAPYQRIDLLKDSDGTIHMIEGCGATGDSVIGDDWDIDCEVCQNMYMRG